MRFVNIRTLLGPDWKDVQRVQVVQLVYDHVICGLTQHRSKHINHFITLLTLVFLRMNFIGYWIPVRWTGFQLVSLIQITANNSIANN